MLEGMDETLGHIREQFPEAFPHCEEVFHLGKRTLDALCESTDRSEDQLPGTVCIAALTKLLRQHLSVCLLCERGLADEAELLMRAMFEVVITVRGLLRRDIRLPTGAPEQNPSIEMRARLIVAKGVVADEKWLRLAGQETKCDVPAEAHRAATSRVATIENEIGEAWIEWVGKRSSHFGLSVEGLARQVEMGDYYHSAYRPQSMGGHSSDLDRFVVASDKSRTGKRGDAEYRLSPDCDSAPSILNLANELVCTTLLVVDGHFGLGLKQQVEELRPKGTVAEST